MGNEADLEDNSVNSPLRHPCAEVYQEISNGFVQWTCVKKFLLVTLVSDMVTEKGLKKSVQRKGRALCKQGNEVSAVGEADESDTVNLYDRKEFKSNLFI